jgi:heterodisulfide reductase subunit C/nitrate reductase gamma subunit
MLKQIVFVAATLITLVIFLITAYRLYRYYKLTLPYSFGRYGKRLMVMMDVAFFQTKIFRRPIVGLMHAIVFWGFCAIVVGTIEIILDGFLGTERILYPLGWFYDLITASGDIFAALIIICILAFLIRRVFMHLKRFNGAEMKKKSHQDANFALSLILLLMLSLLGLNVFYITSCASECHGLYPVSAPIAAWLGSGEEDHLIMEFFWWSHILLIFLFANILPYSKHFHVFMSVPNTFLTRLEPLGKLTNMDDITREVKLMIDPNATFEASEVDIPVSRFGVKDVEDVSWKNYLDSLACTECGRCTAVCPANTTGKMLSPRKIFMDLRARMKEKGPGLVRKGMEYSDSKSLLRDYISEEELWACTTCNACAQECPVNINHPTLIIDMRRYLVMEEGNAPAGSKAFLQILKTTEPHGSSVPRIG